MNRGPWYSFEDALRAKVKDEIENHLEDVRKLLQEAKSEYEKLKWAYHGLEQAVKETREDIYSHKHSTGVNHIITREEDDEEES